jgi:hypothetical protein
VAAGLIVLAASWIFAGPLRAGFDGLAGRLRSSDEPLDVARAIDDIRDALGHGALVAAIALGLARFATRRPAFAGSFAIALMCLDLGLANAYHVVTVPQSAFEGTPRALELIREAERASPAPGPFRVQRVGRWWPVSWSEGLAPRRFEEITRWERDSLRPNYGMPLGVESTFYFDTIEPLDYGVFFLPWTLDPDEAAVRTYHLKPGQKVWYYPRRGLDLWNTRYFIVPARLVWDSPARGYASLLPRSTFIYPAPGSFNGPGGPARRAQWEASDDFRILRNEAAFPRAWVVHRAYLLPTSRGLQVADSGQVLQKLLYQGDEFWHAPGVQVRDPRRVAWVETDRPAEVDRLLSRAEPDPAEQVSVTLAEPVRVELSAVLRSPGLVVLSDVDYPGWELTVDGRPAEILRTNRAMRGVALPAGAHRLVFHYDPPSFRLGIAVSLIGLVALAAVVALAIRRPRGDSWPEPEPASG